MDTTTDRPTSPTMLFWSETGEIACGDHTPHYRSDTWNWGRWTFMAVADVEAWRAETGDLPVCETCRRAAQLPPF